MVFVQQLNNFVLKQFVVILFQNGCFERCITAARTTILVTKVKSRDWGVQWRVEQLWQFQKIVRHFQQTPTSRHMWRANTGSVSLRCQLWAHLY